MVFVTDEKEFEARAVARRERIMRLCEGKSKRFKRRMERVAATQFDEPPRVRVLPKNEEFRKLMSHPDGNLSFREKGSIEWPLDGFTIRRLEDGDVTLDPSYAHQPIHDVHVEPRRVAGAAHRAAETRRASVRPRTPPAAE